MHLYTHYPLDPLPQEDEEAGAPPVPDLKQNPVILQVDLNEEGRPEHAMLLKVVHETEELVDYGYGNAGAYVSLDRDDWNRQSSFTMAWGQLNTP